MEVTNVDIMPVKDSKTYCVAYVSIVLDNELTLNYMRLFKREDCFTIAYPSDLNEDEGDWYQSFHKIFFPSYLNLRKKIKIAVIAEYKKVIDEVDKKLKLYQKKDS